jgi:hypothetical protein
MQSRVPKDTLVVMRAPYRDLALAVGWCCALTLDAGPAAPSAPAAELPAGQLSFTVTHVAQIRPLASQTPSASCSIRLEGDVWWANPASGKLVLKDDSGAEELEMDLAGQPVEAGQKARLEGNGTITPAGAGFRI